MVPRSPAATHPDEQCRNDANGEQAAADAHDPARYRNVKSLALSHFRRRVLGRDPNEDRTVDQPDEGRDNAKHGERTSIH